MNFKVLHSSAINAAKWNDCVERYQMDIYDEFHFLNAVCLDNWYGFVWGDYEKILPFYRKKKWGILPYICMPPFCQKFDNRPLSEEEWEGAWTYLKSNNLKIDYAVMDRKEESEAIEKFNFVLDKSDKNIDQIRENYSSLLVKNLSKAKKELELNLELSHVALELFLASLPLFKKLVFKKYALNFWKLKSSLLKYNYALDKVENKQVAILMYVQLKNRVYLLFPYSSDEGKKMQAMSFLINSIIEQNEIKVIDFEGSSIESIANFYSQFGAEKQSFWSLNWKCRFFPI
ncbi:MAG: hypothetical protein JNL75_02060 [Chitinophagales bacterium]|nr:hypothetical protein [Chitinophagales bacterium]